MWQYSSPGLHGADATGGKGNVVVGGIRGVVVVVALDGLDVAEWLLYDDDEEVE